MSESAAPANAGQAAPVSATTPGATGGGVPTTPAVSDWTSSFNDDVKGYVQAKGFKDPGAVVESYRNFEKLHGVPQDRLLKLPEKADAPEWKDIYGKLGRPSTPDEYGLKGSEKDGGKFAKEVSGWFHELGLSKTQGLKLAEKMDGYAAAAKTQQEGAKVEAADQQEKALHKEWGAAVTQNEAVARQAVSRFGVDAATIDQLETVMGYSGVMKFFHSIGQGLGEQGFVGGGKGQSGFGASIPTPSQAQYKIQQLKGDTEFVKRFAQGGSQEVEEMNRLHQYAYPSH